ncbi:uncharacterized mitochondrial protein AtMg00810-like [Solanum lycopersicum]|uniref:uncharacterized mitochondrial protein AtMg00810-like n=1 Tax=Solanum lycopersicum TaxID=4081 RepID=UPI0002BC9EA6|nr:uncharacterized protein LOC109120904 [Solanum lycopersicum]
MTRVNISVAVQTFSQFMHAPKQSHMEAALRVVSTGTLTTYCDSDWGTCVQTRRSITGYLEKFERNSSPRNRGGRSKSEKQDTVARSSAQAEFKSMASTVAGIT